METLSMSRLVKSEDLNHHGTLFAGRMSEWFVEGAFIAAASSIGNPKNIVCKKLHGLSFNAPVKKGEIISLKTKVVLVGKTSLTVYGFVTKLNDTKILVDGFITFVNVDENGNKMPHNLTIPEPTSDNDIKLIEKAKSLS